MAFDVLDHRLGGALVVLHLGQVQQFGGAGEPGGQAPDAVDDLVQRGALAAERLRPLRIVPDIGAFQFAGDFFQTFDLEVEVKDTP
jgi:hypothetical protein